MSKGTQGKKLAEDIQALDGVIMIETITGNRYPITTHGRTNEQAVCQATYDLKLPCRMVTEGE